MEIIPRFDVNRVKTQVYNASSNKYIRLTFISLRFKYMPCGITGTELALFQKT
jgi:hypothetical protein